ncbi:inositol/phosphatidylinositol phosphatase [Crepidotus variabilis]|uniref:Inositol/phosphatidylinositol phosphatase n=1 Tax=Crepidotus variabilis TaxID=179855 RepID=A0A9P6ESR0_9AGAR|nr:inositol/phosphatidylinositol phosphatase [Crepidotus variabilis]
MRPLHQRYTLFTDRTDTYIFVPEGETQSLTVHRSTGDIVVNSPKTNVPYTAYRSEKVIYGILGLISLSLTDYLIVITGRTLQGRLMGHDVYRATDFDILPLAALSPHDPPHPVEAHLLGLIRSHLSGGNFLYSYTYDLTRRMQKQWETREEDGGKALWEVVDERFFWNKFLHTKFIETATAGNMPALGSYILPIMYGTFEVHPAFLHGRHMQLALISRRSRYRAGTRYFRRGIDHDGHVANFNETEQILLVQAPNTPGAGNVDDDNFVSRLSFVQIRGSVPLFWSEINTLRYKPDLQVMELPDTKSAMAKHLVEQNKTYGRQSLVNLVNQKGHEKPVKEAYERYVAELDLPDVKYEFFDFHGECKHMRWDRISVLIDRMKEDLEKYKYFQLDSTAETPKCVQSGIVRTNCMDNLDRTNVVQATLAKYTLNLQLQDLGIISASDGVDDFESFSKVFREMWADHADAIANAYGGSGALKSDFTRTNVRTKKGALEDGYKSVTRYLKNNFFDGSRQDGFDLVTGSWIPKRGPSASLFLVKDPRPLVTRSMPPVVSFSLFMICAGLTLPRTSDYSLLYYFLLWFTILSVALTFMVVHGVDYVAWPRLNPLTEIIYYNGPGFRSAHHGKGLGGKNQTEPNWKKAKWLTTGLRKAAQKVGVEEVELGTMKKRVD